MFLRSCGLHDCCLIPSYIKTDKDQEHGQFTLECNRPACKTTDPLFAVSLRIKKIDSVCVCMCVHVLMHMCVHYMYVHSCVHVPVCSHVNMC